MGFLGASIAFLMEWGLYEAVARGVSSNDALQLIDVIPFKELRVPVAASFAGAGIFIGVGGSLSAIRKVSAAPGPGAVPGLGGSGPHRRGGDPSGH